MATAKEFDELFGQYEIEQDPKKKLEILEKMRKNVLERNGYKDEFTLQRNNVLRISQADYGILVKISHNLEGIKRREQREIINDEERERELRKNKYSKEHPYPDFNNFDH